MQEQELKKEKSKDIKKPYQVYNSGNNSVECYFDNEFEAQNFSNQFENTEVYDLRLHTIE